MSGAGAGGGGVLQPRLLVLISDLQGVVSIRDII